MKKYGGLKKARVLECLDEIQRLYYQDGLGLRQIAQRLGVSYGILGYTLRGIGFRTRTIGEALLTGIAHGHREAPWLKAQKRGVEHPSWKGGRFKGKGGYIYKYAPGHPRVRDPQHPYVREHILIWEEANGKLLPEDWAVHHLNGIKTDNRPVNLLAMPKKSHHSYLMIQALKRRLHQLEAELQQYKAQGRILR